jgi:hypothetical protein
VEDFKNIAKTIYNLSSFDDMDDITSTFVTKAMQLAGPCKRQPDGVRSLQEPADGCWIRQIFDLQI